VKIEAPKRLARKRCWPKAARLLSGLHAGKADADVGELLWQLPTQVGYWAACEAMQEPDIQRSWAPTAMRSNRSSFNCQLMSADAPKCRHFRSRTYERIRSGMSVGLRESRCRALRRVGRSAK
jgi:hypothetical protein